MEINEFQDSQIEQKASRLITECKIKVDGRYGDKVHFTTLPLSAKNHEHKVILDLETGKHFCNCRWCSLHPDIPCAQIRACQRFFEAVSKIHNL